MFFLRQPSSTTATVNVDQVVWLSDPVRSQGARISGGSGSGKTVLASLIAFQDWKRGKPAIIVDPYGSFVNTVLGMIWRDIEASSLSAEGKTQRWLSVKYVDVAARWGYVTPFPLLYRYPGETLYSVGERLVAAITRWDPDLKTASIQGLNSIIKVLIPAIMDMAALGPAYQVTEIPELLRSLENKGLNQKWQTLLAQALANDPSVAPAVRFFTEEYPGWKDQTRERSVEALEVKLAPFLYNPTMMASFAASQPGLNWDEVIAQGNIVLLDFSGLHHEHRRFALLWIVWFVLIEYFKHRGSGYHHRPVSLFLEEISAYQSENALVRQMLADDLNELINILRRQYRIWLTVIHQENYQFDTRIRQNLASLGCQILGVSHDYQSALETARDFFPYQPLVKRQDPVWGRNAQGQPIILDYRPQYYSFEEQYHMLAQLLQRQKQWKFMARLPEAEGGARGPVRQLDIARMVPPFVDEAILAELRVRLSGQSGLPVDQVVAEILARAGQPVPPRTQSAIVPEGEQVDREGYVRAHESKTAR